SLREIPQWVGVDRCFEDGKGSEFLLQNFLEQVNGEAFALKMTNVGNGHPILSIEEFVILHVARHKHLCASGYCIRDQQTSRSAAEGHPAEFSGWKGGMSDNFQPEGFFEVG